MMWWQFGTATESALRTFQAIHFLHKRTTGWLLPITNLPSTVLELLAHLDWSAQIFALQLG